MAKKKNEIDAIREL